MTDTSEIRRSALEFLRSHDVGIVATVDDDGQPYASPVYFAETGELEIFFLTSSDTHKSDNLQGNDRIAFTVGTGPEYISLMIRGRAEAVAGDEYQKALVLVLEKVKKDSTAKWPVQNLDEIDNGDMVLYKIVPEEATFLNLNAAEQPKSIASHLHHLLP